jgi:hypothetical protein
MASTSQRPDDAKAKKAPDDAGAFEPLIWQSLVLGDHGTAELVGKANRRDVRIDR